MVFKPRDKQDPSIIPVPSLSFDTLCSDWEDWPRLWHVEHEDIAIGERILHIVHPFMMDLLQHGLAKKTLQRHRDHLQMLGGEIIRRRHYDPDLVNKPIGDLLFDLLEEDGGPLIWPRITEPAQRTFDSTCAKLFRFLSAQKKRL